VTIAAVIVATSTAEPSGTNRPSATRSPSPASAIPAAVACRLKVALNSWIVAVVEATAETLALAEGLGVAPETLLDALSGGLLDLPLHEDEEPGDAERRLHPVVRLALAAKDAGLALEAGAEAGLELPMLAAIRARLEIAAEEHGDEDLAATYLLSAPAGR
jgi:3-hydroxyisobutyrate dehydrogenase